MAVTTTSTLPAPVQQTLNLTLLSVPTPQFIFKIPATKEKQPRKGGRIARFRRYNPLTAKLVPLGNTGVTPPSSNLTAIDIDAQLSWYGDWIDMNEQVVLQNQDAALNEAALRLGVGLRQTEDQLLANMLKSTASMVNATNGTNGDNPTEITREDINITVRSLLSANAVMFLSGIQGEDRFGSAPVRSAFFSLSHTDLSADLDEVDGFTNVWEYPNQQSVLDAEWGSAGNVRFLISSIGATEAFASNLGATVYDNFIAGRESYGCIEQDGATAEFIYRPAIYSGPLAQNVSLGYKFSSAEVLLNNAWIINLRTTLAN